MNGGLAFGCNRAKSRLAPSGRALLSRSFSLRSYAWRKKPRASKSRKTAARGAQHHARRPGANSGFTVPKAPGGLEPGHGCAIAGREAGGRAARLFAEGRRPGPGKTSSRHGGGVEAVSAGFTESEVRAPRKCAAPVSSEVRDRGVRGSVTRVRGPTSGWQGRTGLHGARAIRRSDRCVVKRTVLQSRWAASR